MIPTGWSGDRRRRLRALRVERDRALPRSALRPGSRWPDDARARRRRRSLDGGSDCVHADHGLASCSSCASPKPRLAGPSGSRAKSDKLGNLNTHSRAPHRREAFTAADIVVGCAVHRWLHLPLNGRATPSAQVPASRPPGSPVTCRAQLVQGQSPGRGLPRMGRIGRMRSGVPFAKYSSPRNPCSYPQLSGPVCGNCVEALTTFG